VDWSSSPGKPKEYRESTIQSHRILVVEFSLLRLPFGVSIMTVRSASFDSKGGNRVGSARPGERFDICTLSAAEVHLAIGLSDPYLCEIADANSFSRSDLMDLVVRFLLGGTIVSLFALSADVLKPKGFAGLFGAAPSVALATLGLTIATQGKLYAAMEARSMIAGAALADSFWRFLQSFRRARCSSISMSGKRSKRLVFR
jgi:hypothetical protein